MSTIKQDFLFVLSRVIPTRIKRALWRLPFHRYLISHNTLVSMKYAFLFLFLSRVRLSLFKRLALLVKFDAIDRHCSPLHCPEELLIPTCALLSMPTDTNGCVVEAGAYRGAGTAKLSLVCALARKTLYVFDSFKGLPANSEPTAKTALGYECAFAEGDYVGSLDEVKRNVRAWGNIESCVFVPGYFNQTMPHFTEEIDMLFCDIDLAMSYRDCVTYLWSNITEGGLFFSQDLHIPIVAGLLSSSRFWVETVGENHVPKHKKYTKRFGCYEKKATYYTVSSESKK